MKLTLQLAAVVLGQVTYKSLERPPQDTRDGFDLHSAQASFAWPRVDLARPLQP